MAAGLSIPIDMVYYGYHDSTIDTTILNAHPEFLVGNSAAGPWHGNANISTFTSAGIKYFEYIDGGYETKYARPIPTDIYSNLNYITAAAQAGAYGIFLDEVSDGIYTAADYSYLQQIADKAHSLGLKVVFNTGALAWADQLMNYCDYTNSSETWQNAPLTASQSKWASRTWMLTYGVGDANTAASLTNAALSKGIRAHYATVAFGSLPSYFTSYAAQIAGTATTTTAAASSSVSATQSVVTFTSNPAGSEVWLDYSYKGVTPMTLSLPTGSHSIGFNLYGYHGNTPLVSSFSLGSTSLTVNGDLVNGQIVTSGAVSSATTGGSTVVSFTSNPSGSEVWLDYVYKGVTPLKVTVSAGSHHIGFYKAGYYNGQAVGVNFSTSGQASLNVLGDMQTGFSSVW